MMMKPMLPTLSFEIPTGDDWVYETKYDGFRAFLVITEEIQLLSRNGKNLLTQFPEAIQFFENKKNELIKFSPIILDGELSILENDFKSNFSQMQYRGRLKSKQKIDEAYQIKKSVFLAFDLLTIKGENITNDSFTERKKQLLQFAQSLRFPTKPNFNDETFIQYVPYYLDYSPLWEKITKYDGEGIIAKQKLSKWLEGKRVTQWIKIKNWKKINCFITKYEKKNGYFEVSVYNDSHIVPIGIFKNGLSPSEREALLTIIQSNNIKNDANEIVISPSICLELLYLEQFEDGLREPYFSRFLFQMNPKDCTIDQLDESHQSLTQVDITHPEKPLWRKYSITKKDYLFYLKQIYPYMSPFLTNRTLTVIRYPHGTFGEAFFQKNCPDYAPDFVETYLHDGINYIVCNKIETLLWLGNQLAIEFHIPFQTIGKSTPSEIVIDLDPPTRKEFAMAVEAALYIKKEMIDKIGLIGFIKVSGNRGLQIYFPVPENSPITWEDARLITEFIANFIIAKNPNHFTIERLKKKRGNKLYIDYIQHGEGKTIICPFSLRGNENAGVATPIFWSDLYHEIQPDGLSMENVLKSLKEKGNPFESFFQIKEQPFQEILHFLRKNKKGK